MIVIRTLIFYIVLFVSVVLWASICLIVCPFLNFENRFYLITRWSAFIVFCAKWICSIEYQIEGLENIPSTPTVVVSKHQSTWETFYLQNLFAPTATVLKKELISLPFFGWCLKLLDPIIIDRRARKKALAQIETQGVEQLNKNRWIVIYPEGTRITPGEDSKLAQGAFVLAKKAKVPILPVAHNAGEFWRPDHWLKYPGKIIVRIGRPIDTKDSLDVVITECASWMNHTMHDLSPLERERRSEIKAKPRNNGGRNNKQPINISQEEVAVAITQE